MTDSIKTAIGLRESWLREQDPDNFDHVVDSLKLNTIPLSSVQKDGGLKVSITFVNNVPKEPWFLVLETHLVELGYVIEERKTLTNGSEEMKILF